MAHLHIPRECPKPDDVGFLSYARASLNAMLKPLYRGVLRLCKQYPAHINCSFSCEWYLDLSSMISVTYGKVLDKPLHFVSLTIH